MDNRIPGRTSGRRQSLSRVAAALPPSQMLLLLFEDLEPVKRDEFDRISHLLPAVAAHPASIYFDTRRFPAYKESPFPPALRAIRFTSPCAHDRCSVGFRYQDFVHEQEIHTSYQARYAVSRRECGAHHCRSCEDCRLGQKKSVRWSILIAGDFVLTLRQALPLPGMSSPGRTHGYPIHRPLNNPATHDETDVSRLRSWCRKRAFHHRAA